MLNQRLSQKLLQKLSPQQIQLMKLLQVPTDQLEQRIKEELEANPALEEGEREDQDASSLDDVFRDEEKGDDDSGGEGEETRDSEELDLDDYIGEDDVADYKTRDDSYGDDEDENKTVPYAVTDTFHENLSKQLGMCELDERQEKIAQQILGSIDDDGYLRREISAIVDDLAF